MQRPSLVVAAAALAALLAAGPAAAQRTGWYIGGGPGQANADFVRSDFSPYLESGTYRADDSDFAPRIFGGIRVAPHLAIEFGLASLGGYKHRFDAPAGVAIYDYTASALTAAVMGNLPLAGGLSVNGRAGVAFTAATLRLKVDNGTARVPFCDNSWWYNDCTATNTNFYWGLGAQYDFTRNWGMRVDYDNYGEVGQEFETGRADIETWSVNVVYSF
jgi:opacity protein-like surface antigen